MIDRQTSGIPLVGLLAGLAAASIGVAPLPGGIRPWHLFAVLVVVVVYMRDNGQSLSKLRLRWIDFFAAVFIVGSSVVELSNGEELRYNADVLGTLSPAFYFLIFWSVRSVVIDLFNLERFLTYFVLPSVLVAILSIGQIVLPSVFAWVTRIAPSGALDTRGATGGGLRATGFVGDWTGNGFYFCGILAAVACVVILRKSESRRSAAMVVVGVLAFAAVMCTITLAAVITACGIIVTFILATRMNVRVLIGLATGGLVLMASFGDLISGRVADQAAAGVRVEGMPSWLPNTVAFRWVIWTRETLPAIGERPVVGWGSGVYGDTGSTRIYPPGLSWGSPESQWFAEALSFGVPITLVLAALFGAALFAAKRSIAILGAAAWPILVMLVLVVVMSAISPVLTNRGFPTVFWPILGALMGTRQSSLSSSKEALQRL